MINRKDYIDVAKALGIIMVVWGHSEGIFSNYFYAFHMPLFFFLSGLLFKSEEKIFKTIRKKFKSLLVPFYVWNLLLVIPFWVLYYWKEWDIKVLFKYILTILLTLDKVPMLGATWFLPALFWTSIIFTTVYHLFKKDLIRNIFIFLGSLIFLIIGLNFTLPYRISRVFICSFFYVLGYFYAKYLGKYAKENVINNIIAVACLVSFVILTNCNDIDLGSNRIQYPILFLIGACAAIFFTLIISKDIIVVFKKSFVTKHLLFLGRNTMPIVIWHFCFFRIAILVQIVFANAPLNSITSFPTYDSSGFWWVLYLLTGLYGSILWGLLIEKIKIKFLSIKSNKGESK